MRTAQKGRPGLESKTVEDPDDIKGLATDLSDVQKRRIRESARQSAMNAPPLSDEQKRLLATALGGR